MDNQFIVNHINQMFPPEDIKYPVAFLRDGHAVVSSESCGLISSVDGENIYLPVIDYYGEYRGGYPWVDKRLAKWLKNNGLVYEWENPACIIVSKE